MFESPLVVRIRYDRDEIDRDRDFEKRKDREFPCVPPYPGSHWQVTALVRAAVSVCALAGHGVHSPSPVTGGEFSVLHSVQSPVRPPLCSHTVQGTRRGLREKLARAVRLCGMIT